MGINLDSAELDMARQLAAHQGMTLDGAVSAALRRDIERQGLAAKPELTPEEREQRSREFHAMVRDIQNKIAAVPLLDPRPYREILYDEDGLPI
ncbi:type II toxin-antitoxin system VapB family antitoxin [Sphingomonas sp.]|uniref:type II toxin-antitoxin system VapB family antitoxin n=1 Tax=Sphingomonas sp. TaxID=28214 RepID=UPI0035BBA09B